MLATYLTNVQNLLGTGSAGNLYPTTQLITYINQARQQIAIEGQCIRVLPPIAGPITSITVGSGGSGYGPFVSVIVSAPDSPSGRGANYAGVQATAVSVLSGGAVTSVAISNPGDGYFSPVVSFSGSGQGATAFAFVSGASSTVALKEVYNFSDLTPLVATSGSGVQSIYMVNSVSVLWGTFRYTLMHMSFSKYQAYVRTYTAGYYYIPAVFSQFGQGVNGSLYLYPIPNSPYQIELDTCCLPNPLATDNDPEAIPYPWVDCVPFLAAYYAFTGSQRFSDADRIWGEFEKYMKRARSLSQPRSTSNWYGRG